MLRAFYYLRSPLWSFSLVLFQMFSAQDDGFKPIFDGQVTRWLGGGMRNSGVSRMAQLVGESTEDNKVDVNRFLVWDQGEVDDFVLRLKFKVSGTDRANSGVQFSECIIRR